MRVLLVIAMTLLISGCGSIISRTVPGQGHGNQYYPGVQWDVRDSSWRYITILDLPFHWCLIRYCCRLTPVMALITN